MRFSSLFWCVLLAMVVGCKPDSGGSDSGATEPKKTETAKGDAPKSEALKGELVGIWQMSTDPAKKDGSGASFTAGLGGLFDFEFTSDTTFELSLLGLLAEGKVERRGNKLTLTVERVGGLDPEEAKKSKVTTDQDPLVFEGELAADGNTMVIWTDKPEEKTTFKKLEDKVGPPKVTPEEKELVGRWIVDDLQNAEPLEEPMDKAMDYSIRRGRLELREDGTFRFRVGLRVDGKWNRKDQKIALVADLVGGEPSKAGEADVVEGRLLDDGRIEIIAPDGKSKLFLKKS
jgi:hypothetical protein